MATSYADDCYFCDDDWSTTPTNALHAYDTPGENYLPVVYGVPRAFDTDQVLLK